MIYVCTCPECGLIVRTERPEGEKACVCSTPPVIVEEAADAADESGN